MSDVPTPADASEPTDVVRCTLSHPLFTSLGLPVFRRSEQDSVPVMVVPLGEREGVVPLHSLQREFGISDASDDGRMLALIAGALDFVAALRPGDPLPSEVLTGEASWSPEPLHLEVAQTRLRLQLVDWLTAGNGVDQRGAGADTLLRVADDPRLRQQVQEAIRRAADALGLASAAEVVNRLETLGHELAYIEALRDRLYRRLRAMADKIDRLSRGWRSDATHIEMLTQVKRLLARASRRIGSRFEELDAQTGEIMAALRNTDSQRAFIRSNRDWLYRSQRAWEQILAEWDRAPGLVDESTLALLWRTYRFLAPRFMPVTEWISASRPGHAPPVNHSPRMIW